MALIAIISEVLIVGAALSLLHLAYSKLPQIRLVDPLSSSERREALIKRDLFAKRLEREAAQVTGLVGKVVGWPWQLVRDGFRRLAGRLTALERRYEHAKHSSGSKEDRLAAAQKLVDEALDLAKKGDAIVAEKKLVEAVTLAPKFAPAYLALGYLYEGKRSFEEAKEAFSFAASLAKTDPTAPFALAFMLEKADRLEEAQEWYQRTLLIEPKSPKFLTALLESALELRDIATAEDTLATLIEVNPQNKKIKTYTAQLEDLHANNPPKAPKKKK
jgi:tetratricopeptide (TPR) repeat protein